MINKLKLSLAALLTVCALGMVAVPAYAECKTAAECIGVGAKQASPSNSKTSIGDLTKTIVNILLYVLGAVAVIMIIIGGIKYTTSNGDPSSVTSAKNTILYAVVGLIVAIMAYAIVNFVITTFK